ncbi:MAG: hypothetical protein Q9165_000420 [Trypethelium subeluteriae]
MPENPTKIETNKVAESDTASPDKAEIAVNRSQSNSATVSHFRRYQTLHVLHFGRVAAKAGHWKLMDRLKSSNFYTGGSLVFSLILTVVLCLFGLYGTSVILLVSAISQLSSRFVRLYRPPGYLESNEASKDAFMLTATHSNAMTWYLFMGDRGAVDTLLNKTMICVRGDQQEQWCSSWLRLAHAIQLLSMTFVAAQKGWDGVGLLVLVAIEWIRRWNMRKENLANSWLRKEGVHIKVRSYEFTGRGTLLGAVQALSNSRTTTWMDGIMVPHARRDVLLRRIEKLRSGEPHEIESSWSENDMQYISRSAALSIEAAEMIDRELKAEDGVHPDV